MWLRHCVWRIIVYLCVYIKRERSKIVCNGKRYAEPMNIGIHEMMYLLACVQSTHMLCGKHCVYILYWIGVNRKVCAYFLRALSVYSVRVGWSLLSV